MSKRSIITMDEQLAGIKPVAASRHILALTGELETLAVAKNPRLKNRPSTTHLTVAENEGFY